MITSPNPIGGNVYSNHTSCSNNGSLANSNRTTDTHIQSYKNIISLAHYSIKKIEVTFVSRTVNHTTAYNVHLLPLYNRVAIIKIVIRTFESFRCEMPDYIIFRFNFTLSIRTYGSGNTFFCEALSFHFVGSTLYCREKYKYFFTDSLKRYQSKIR